MPLGGERVLGTTHIFIASRVDAFMPAAEYRARFDEYIAMSHACPLRKGAERVRVPGGPEWEEEAVRIAHGVPLHPDNDEDLQTLVREREIAFV